MKIGEQSLRRLANFLGVSPEWLASGQGSPLPAEPAHEWPVEQMAACWGIRGASLPAEWPAPLRRHVTLAVLFGLEPRMDTFREMVQAARDLGTDAPLPLSLSAAILRQRSLAGE